MCDFKAKTATNLKKHIKTHSTKRTKYKCDICHVELLSLKSLTKHKEIIHEGSSKVFKCDKCDYETFHEGNLRKHIAKDHLGIRYNCDICDYSSAQLAELKDHARKHLPMEQQLKCDRCTYVTHAKPSMKTHMKTNHSENRQCLACNFVAKSRNEYFQHFELTHSSTKCVDCT